MPPEKYDRVEVGNRIKQMRQTQGITGQNLAKRARVSPGYLSEVERGIPAVSIDKLSQIADGLGTRLDTLLGKAEEAIDATVVTIPAALSAAAEKLNLSHRATLALLQGQRSLTARRSKSEQDEWTVDRWIGFHQQVKDYLPD